MSYKPSQVANDAVELCNARTPLPKMLQNPPHLASVQPHLTSTTVLRSPRAALPTSSLRAKSLNTQEEPILSLNRLFDLRVRLQPDEVVVAFPRVHPSRAYEFDQITYRQLNALVGQAAVAYSERLPPRKQGQPLLTVGLLAESGFDYVVTELALARLGHCVLLLSPNNSAPAIASLLSTTKAAHLLHSELYTQVALNSVQDITSAVTVQPWIPIRDTGSSLADPSPRSALSQAQESLEPAFIVHSSGSTGFPKPIWITNKASVENLSSSFGRDAFITVPLYHNYGHASLWRAMWSCKKLFIFPQELPLTTPNLLKALAGCREVQQFYAVPYVLKLLAETDEGMQLLRRFDLVTSAGSACPTDVGDRLVADGVHLVSNYGATEVGQLMSSMRDFDNDREWSAVRMNDALRPYAVWLPQGDGETFELAIKEGWPAQTKSNRADGSYATSDLFRRHPSLEDAYLFVGRCDDTLVHSNGEKTNPIPMELSIRGSPHVAEAIVFGAGKPQAGALIVLSGQHSNPDAAMRLVWPSIEEANSKAPSHSRIIPELVHLLPQGTKFTSADKGSLIRSKVIATFTDLIDNLYAKYESGECNSAKVKPAAYEDALQLVRGVVVAIAGNMGDDDDLFDLGIDSLTSTRIVNAIRRTIDVGDQKLPSTLVFECPTIAKLAQRIMGQQEKADIADTMLSMVETYAGRVLAAPHSRPKAESSAVVLTGATGSLGAHLLVALSRQSVSQIWCLCRAKNDQEAEARVEASLKTRRLPSIQNLTAKVTCLAADLTAADMGLSESSFATIAQRATGVIHAAYPVNFNMSVESFATSIQSSVHLMNICSQSTFQCTFHFCSSVSAATRRKSSTILESISSDPLDAQEMGYAQSKWVVEAICRKSSEEKSQPCVVHRIGQMVGDSEHGVWNETEAIPLMFKAAQTVGALPDLEEQVSWLPVDQAAAMIAAVTASPSGQQVFHILNDVLTPYRSVYDGLRAAGVSFEVVDKQEWVHRLRNAKDQNPSTNPTIKLVDFYAQKYSAGSSDTASASDDMAYKERRSAKTWDATEMRNQIPRQAEQLQPIGQAAIGRMVSHWRSSGFLT